MKMLLMEGVQPNKIAYDRPSPKLLGFLKKHFGLSFFIPQNNNFVIFKDFFDSSYRIPSKNDEVKQSKQPKAEKQLPPEQQFDSFKPTRNRATGSNQYPTKAQQDPYASQNQDQYYS